ncbi:MAG: undecaprenyl-diphosphate phosphatase [Candidatus Gracilibacteria bacterium]|nr:undecaprenyl-diphosphate phosphatase [Candidatus Gracilibacteria bacterium]
MSIFQAVVLGFLQGVTEFLPVSSSGHLVLAETWFGLEVEKLLSFDVVLHAGTLVALLVYFRKDIVEMFYELIRRPKSSKKGVWLLIVATIPIVIFAPFMKDPIEQVFRAPQVVVMMLGVTAVFLAMAELIGKRQNKQLKSFGVALLMGVFQVLAVIPGVSRSGSTIVGGLLGNLTREEAARFAFLMAIPAIGGAMVFLSKDLLEAFGSSTTVGTLGVEHLMVGFFTSMVASFGCIYGMLHFLRKRSLWWFVGYLALLNVAWVFSALSF